jgi:hypothetical protein
VCPHHPDLAFERMAIRVRDAESGDLSFLAEMLCEAAFPPEAERQPASDVFADPRMARWVKNYVGREILG